MTLILSTICKNGICVCADKRSARPNGAFQDDLCKIYSFKKIPLIIYNHGVNKFNNKMWNEYCLEYEELNKWVHYNLVGIRENFRKFIEKSVHQELEKNFQNNLLTKYTSSGFVFCGKTDQDTKLKISELFWAYNSGGLQIEKKPHGRLVLSGTGQEHLKDYFEKNKNIFTNEYWENLDINQAEKELKNLFLVAVKEKNRLHSSEFSDDFDLKCRTV